MAEPAAGYLLPAGVLDAVRLKVRDEGFVRNKAIYMRWACCRRRCRRVLEMAADLAD